MHEVGGVRTGTWYVRDVHVKVGVRYREGLSMKGCE